FDYCGNEWRDIAIWRCARSAVVVNAPESLVRQAESQLSVAQVFPASGTKTWRVVLRALRPHQWAKNVLVLVPLFAAHKAGELGSVAHGVAALVAFSLCASSVYLLNDMLDLEADRGHARKSK